MTDEAYKAHCGHEWRQCWRGTNNELLRAISPFDPADELIACPKCKQTDDLHMSQSLAELVDAMMEKGFE